LDYVKPERACPTPGKCSQLNVPQKKRQTFTTWPRRAHRNTARISALSRTCDTLSVSRAQAPWERSEEDAVIDMLQETRATNYCDNAFGADATSLYRDPNFVPAYDASAPGPVRWVR
jgi:hypothetical protein